MVADSDSQSSSEGALGGSASVPGMQKKARTISSTEGLNLQVSSGASLMVGVEEEQGISGSGEVETLELEGVTHYPWTAPGPVADLVAPELTAAYRAGRPWYGSDGPRQLWARWLLEQGKA